MNTQRTPPAKPCRNALQVAQCAQSKTISARAIAIATRPGGRGSLQTYPDYSIASRDPSSASGGDDGGGGGRRPYRGLESESQVPPSQLVIVLMVDKFRDLETVSAFDAVPVAGQKLLDNAGHLWVVTRVSSFTTLPRLYRVEGYLQNTTMPPGVSP